MLISYATFAQDALKYQTPPAGITAIALAQPTPSVSFNRKGDVMLIMQVRSYPSVEELAQPELKLAGMRINPANFGPSRSVYFTSIAIKQQGSQQELPLTGLPQGARISNVHWSPSGKKIAFTVAGNNAITLWTADIATGVAKQVSNRHINDTWETPYTWMGEDKLLAQVVPEGAGNPPERPAAPDGPTVQQTSGKAAPAATYQDLLKNPFDEALFDYYFQTQPVIISAAGEQSIGTAGIYTSITPSPDKHYFLVKKLRKPYSYLVPASRFPTTIEIWDSTGHKVKELAQNPLDEVRPKGFDATSPYTREHDWREDAAATVYWIAPLDEGDPAKKVPFRDVVYMLAAPFSGEPVTLAKTTMRFYGLTWGNDKLALLHEGMRSQQQVQMSRINPSDVAQPPVTVIKRSTNDGYSDPGKPVLKSNQYDRKVLYLSGTNELLMTGDGASAEGDKPFLSLFNMETGKSRILWRSAPPYYEYVATVTDPDKLQFVISRESNTVPPNYFLQDLKEKKTVQLTAFTNPLPQVQQLQKQQLRYKRKDGVDLTAMLYLPAGYDAAKDGRLPVLMWAYPREYKSARDAAQVRGSQYRFIRIGYGSPIFWATEGYAVMDATEMPIVGEGEQAPNDNFMSQLIMNAEAAIEKITSMGIGDSSRVAVGGHSYGAFMTANLLANTSLFKAGIARSGAYNRTLTPFGFQNEQRTYWQAPEVYYKMSPFSRADHLKTPILLIHGEADNNSGTFPIQSERLYNAIKGNGGTARLVFLPFESHGYAAKENILHMLWEMDQWLNRYVKHANGK